jgi:hypothetical protein
LRTPDDEGPPRISEPMPFATATPFGQIDFKTQKLITGSKTYSPIKKQSFGPGKNVGYGRPGIMDDSPSIENRPKQTCNFYILFFIFYFY